MPLPLLAIATAGITGTVGALSERYGWNLPNYRNLGNPVSPDANVITNAFNRAKQIIIQEEGRKTKAYLDTRGKLTVGIGHLVKPGDNIKLGDTIPEARVDALFAADIAWAFNKGLEQAKAINRYNVEMIARLTSVNFQLGDFPTVFPNTYSLLKSGKAKEVIKIIKTPKYKNGKPANWAAQTPNRALAFAAVLESQFA